MPWVQLSLGLVLGVAALVPIREVVDEEKHVAYRVERDDGVEKLGGLFPVIGGTEEEVGITRPDIRPGEEDHRIEHEHHRVHPLLTGWAELCMNPLVFGRENTGESGEGDVDTEVGIVEIVCGHPSPAQNESVQVLGVSEALPLREAALAMIIELIDAGDRA